MSDKDKRVERTSAEQAAGEYAGRLETWASMAGIRNGCATAFMAGVRWEQDRSAAPQLLEALAKAATELEALEAEYAKSGVSGVQAHISKNLRAAIALATSSGDL